MTVYCVFYIYPDGDGYNVYELIGIGASVESANVIVVDHLALCSDRPRKSDSAPGVPRVDMTEDNNYTYFGLRSACDGIEVSCFSDHRGYVVEKMKVL